MLDVAVVGLGTAARRNYLPAVSSYDGARLRWIVDPNREALEDATARFDTVGCARSTTGIDDRTDVAIVGGPIEDRADVIASLLRSEVPVLAESPIASSETAAREVVERAPEVPCGLVRPLRRAPAVRTLDLFGPALLVGHVTAVTMRLGTPGHHAVTGARSARPRHRWGGVLVGEALHAIDLLTWLFGRNVSLERFADDALGGVPANAEIEWTVRDGEIPVSVEASADRSIDPELRIEGPSGVLAIDPRGTCIRLRRDGAGDASLRVDGGASGFDELARMDVRSFLGAVNGESARYVDAHADVYLLGVLDTCKACREPLRHPWEAMPPGTDCMEVARGR